MLAEHGDLYERRSDCTTLKIRRGSVALTNVVAAPFGLGFEVPIDEVMDGFEVLAEYILPHFTA
jgi:hypothetical protein